MAYGPWPIALRSCLANDGRLVLIARVIAPTAELARLSAHAHVLARAHTPVRALVFVHACVRVRMSAYMRAHTRQLLGGMVVIGEELVALIVV